MDAESYYLKPKVVAERLSLSPSQVYRLAEKGELPSVRIGESVRIPAGALDAYMKAKTQGGKVEPNHADIGQLPTDREELLEVVEAFEERSGHDPFDFVTKWREGEIADTGENVSLAIEALALRAALIDADMVPQTA